jgi:hypothetical protein
MQRFALVVVVSAFPILSLSAQMLSPKEEGLLLPNEQNVSGVVVDSSGHPIEGALIQNTDLGRKIITTDANGRFNLSTRAPAFVIRKPGYDGEFMRTINAKSARITLNVSQNLMAPCANKSSCKAIGGFGGIFCFPKVAGIKVSKQGNDVDDGQRFFSVQSKNGVGSIWHGAGVNWSLGVPSNEEVWLSVDYSERELLADGYTVIDARGKTADERFWRYVGSIGESASYRNVDKESAALLDSVCTLKDKNK